MPKFAATLCFVTNDGKYAASVDITPDMPPTGLTIELIPTYTITGRLVDRTKKSPLANHKITLVYMRFSEYGAEIPGVTWTHADSGVLHSEATTTDSEGFFTLNNVIPGVEYFLRDNDFLEGKRTFGKYLEMPILQPEQYQEPFALGDVFVNMDHTVGNCYKFCNCSN